MRAEPLEGFEEVQPHDVAYAIEETICNAMAKVLGLNRVGLHDDFYEMGGDSLKSIELITKCDENNLKGLNAGDIFPWQNA